MTPGRACGRELAKKLLEREAAKLRAPQDVAGAATAVCRKLHLEVGQFIGSEGFRVLFARALHLAKVEFTFLEVVRVGEYSEGDCLHGLADLVPQRDASEITEGIAAVVGGFVDLLSTFIGDELALHMIHRCWPEVPRVRPIDGDEGRGDG